MFSELDQVDIELVTYSAGVNILLDDFYAPPLKKTKKKGLVLVACRNTLNYNGLNENQLLDGVKIVPSGVVELIKKQSVGWTYIRP